MLSEKKVMTPEGLFTIFKALKIDEKLIWKSNIAKGIGGELENLSDIPLEVLVLVLYSHFDGAYDLSAQTVIAYGAGQSGQKFIPEFSQKVKVREIWDVYTAQKDICGIAIRNSIEENKELDIPIVIFIDDRNIRYDVMNSLRKKGCQNIFYFRDYMFILEWLESMKMTEVKVSEELKKSIEKQCVDFEDVNCSELPVIFSVLPVS